LATGCSAVLFSFSDFFRSLYDERFYPRILFPSAIGKIPRSVFEYYDEAKSQNDEQSEPKKTAQERHVKM